MQHFIPFAFLKAFTAKLFPSCLFAINLSFAAFLIFCNRTEILPFLCLSVRFVFPLVEIFPHKNVINNWKKKSTPCYRLLMCCDIDVPSVAAKSFILPLSVYLTRLINSVLPWDSNKLNCLLHSFSKSAKQFQK